MTAEPLDPPDAATAALGGVLAGLAGLGAVPSWQLSDDALAGGRAPAGLGDPTGPGPAGPDRRRGRLAGAARPARAPPPRALGPRAGPDVQPTGGGRHGAAGRTAVHLRERRPTSPPRGRRCSPVTSPANRSTWSPAPSQALLPPNVPAEALSADAVVAAQGFLLEQAGLVRRQTAAPPRHPPAAPPRPRRRPTPGPDRGAQAGQRSLTLAETLGGMVHVEGLLTPTCGAALRTAIDAWSAPQPAADGTPDPRTAAQRRHDALHAAGREGHRLARPAAQHPRQPLPRRGHRPARDPDRDPAKATP